MMFRSRIYHRTCSRDASRHRRLFRAGRGARESRDGLPLSRAELPRDIESLGYPGDFISRSDDFDYKIEKGLVQRRTWQYSSSLHGVCLAYKPECPKDSRSVIVASVLLVWAGAIGRSGTSRASQGKTVSREYLLPENPSPHPWVESRLSQNGEIRRKRWFS